MFTRQWQSGMFTLIGMRQFPEVGSPHSGLHGLRDLGVDGLELHNKRSQSHAQTRLPLDETLQTLDGLLVLPHQPLPHVVLPLVQVIPEGLLASIEPQPGDVLHGPGQAVLVLAGIAAVGGLLEVGILQGVAEVLELLGVVVADPGRQLWGLSLDGLAGVPQMLLSLIHI